MSAFIIAHSTVKDASKFQIYAKEVAATLIPFKGEVILRGKSAQVLSGVHHYQNVGILKFPDQTAAQAWYNSNAYQALIPNREQAADMVLIGYDEP